MRPSCDKILDLPIVKRKISELFPDDFDRFDDFHDFDDVCDFDDIDEDL